VSDSNAYFSDISSNLDQTINNIKIKAVTEPGSIFDFDFNADCQTQ